MIIWFFMKGFNDKYQVLEVLSQQSNRATWKVKEKDSAKLCVAKVFPLIANGQWQNTSLLKNLMDLQGQSKLFNPIIGIPSLLETFQSDSDFYFIWDYIDGLPLGGDDAAARQLNLSDIYSMGSDVLDVAQSLAKVGLVHSDIKPANLVQDGDGKWHIIDLDIATKSNKTLYGSMFTQGTFVFMAPERFTNRVTFLSDLYGLGLSIVAAFGGYTTAQLAELKDYQTGSFRMDLFLQKHPTAAPFENWLARALGGKPFSRIEEAVLAWPEPESRLALQAGSNLEVDQYRQISSQSGWSIVPLDGGVKKACDFGLLWWRNDGELITFSCFVDGEAEETVLRRISGRGDSYLLDHVDDVHGLTEFIGAAIRDLRVQYTGTVPRSVGLPKKLTRFNFTKLLPENILANYDVKVVGFIHPIIVASKKGQKRFPTEIPLRQHNTSLGNATFVTFDFLHAGDAGWVISGQVSDFSGVAPHIRSFSSNATCNIAAFCWATGRVLLCKHHLVFEICSSQERYLACLNLRDKSLTYGSVAGVPYFFCHGVYYSDRNGKDWLFGMSQ
jgi:serine/threonine protein kinase